MFSNNIYLLFVTKKLCVSICTHFQVHFLVEWGNYNLNVHCQSGCDDVISEIWLMVIFCQSLFHFLIIPVNVIYHQSKTVFFRVGMCSKACHGKCLSKMSPSNKRDSKLTSGLFSHIFSLSLNQIVRLYPNAVLCVFRPF